MNIALIGYRGTGKTTVARLLAESLGWDWHDADIEIERRAGKSIKQIFADSGEPTFRDWETAVVSDLAQLPNVVLALGGGAVMREQNLAALANSRVVWLQADAATLWQRITGDTTTAERRPNLTVAGGFDEVCALLAKREPVYRAAANFAIDTVGKTPAQIAAAIRDWLLASQSD